MFDKIFLYIIIYLRNINLNVPIQYRPKVEEEEEKKRSNNSKELKCVSVVALRLSKRLQFM